MKPLRVAHVTGSISRLGGGLFESVRHLSQETQKNGVEMEIFGLQDEFTQADLPRWSPLTVKTFSIFGPQRFAYAPDLFEALKASANDIVHLHGVWQFPTSAVLRWSLEMRKPYVISTHGMLESWSLSRSRFKKAIANWLYQNAALREATCLRATAMSEVESIRRLGLKNPIAVIPNGVPVPETLPPRRSIATPRRKRALFVSRIHPKKGLLELVRAWRTVNPADWELMIVGPDEGNHLAQVMTLVRELNLQEQIIYGGEIWEDDAKWKCYGDADLFVLPSFSENFGLVIAEALGCGVPAITTRATPWQDLETHRCGWWIETGEAALAKTLTEALAASPAQLREMGLRGRELIQRKYSWAPAGRQMSEVYQWIAGRIPQPQCVLS